MDQDVREEKIDGWRNQEVVTIIKPVTYIYYRDRIVYAATGRDMVPTMYLVLT